MYIIHIASEIAPIAKVGGLGDVLYGLTKELIRQGHHVKVLLPKYDTIDYSRLQNLRVHYRELWSFEGAYSYNNTIWAAELEEITLYLLEPHHPRYFFTRGTIYGCADDIERFLYFSRASMEFLFKSQEKPDILHLHDWPTAAVAILKKEMYETLGLPSMRTLFTIHNLEHQGRCYPQQFSLTGLKGESYLTPSTLQDPSTPYLLNLVQGALVFADIVTTVSPSYAKEIQTKAGSFGLLTTLQQQAYKCYGILNGIDADAWNPANDPYLPVSYSKENPDTLSANRLQCKKQIQQELGLASSSAPLLVSIARLVSQKGPFLLAHAMRYALAKGAQCVLLGSVYSPDMETFFTTLAEELLPAYPNQVTILLTYNEALAHRLYAGADIFLVPSLFEPCGLTQMIALRYGAIPLVRKTGGLADTVFDQDDAKIPPSKRNGFCFANPTTASLQDTLERALTHYQNSTAWQKLLLQAMHYDYTWTKPAQQYIQLYASTIKAVTL